MHIEAYIQHQLSSILWKKSTSFWTPDFFKRTMQCLLPSGLSSSNDTADLDPTTASSEPGDPEPAEPWKERVKRRAGPQLGKQKNGGIFPPKKMSTKKMYPDIPQQPLAISCYRFFLPPQLGVVMVSYSSPQKKWQVPFLVRMTRKRTRGSYFFEDPEIPTPPETTRWENPPGSFGAMGILGLEVDDW